MFQAPDQYFAAVTTLQTSAVTTLVRVQGVDSISAWKPAQEMQCTSIIIFTRPLEYFSDPLEYFPDPLKYFPDPIE
jgi:hypothetical protein